MILKTAFHLFNVIHYVGIIYFLQTLELPGKAGSFGGNWEFLTFWNLWFQLIYFAVALANNFAGSEANIKSKSSKLQKVRDYLFSTTAFPMAVFVSSTFWLIFAYNRDLIFPLKLEKYYPFPTNHMMHTTPIVGQVIELLLSHHIYPSRMAGLATGFGLILVYLSWICFIAYYGGFWVYGVLQVMSPPVRTVFILTCCIVASSFYLVGEKANSLVWSKPASKPKKEAATDQPPAKHKYATRSKAKKDI